MRTLSFLALSLLLTTAASSARPDDPFKDWPQSHLTGTVRDPDGKPISRAKVHLNNSQGPSATLGGNWAFTGADGKYSLRVFVKPNSKALVTEVIVSARGFVQMLKCLPHVTTVGARTRGTSGNPKTFPLPGMTVTVWYSRWVDLMPDGTPIEGAGIAPDIAVDAPQSAYKEKDPTWEKAIQELRKRVSAGGR
jgi:hypothetical protein